MMTCFHFSSFLVCSPPFFTSFCVNFESELWEGMSEKADSSTAAGATLSPESSPYFYCVTAQSATSVDRSVVGHFTSPVDTNLIISLVSFLIQHIFLFSFLFKETLAHRLPSQKGNTSGTLQTFSRRSRCHHIHPDLWHYHCNGNLPSYRLFIFPPPHPSDISQQQH